MGSYTIYNLEGERWAAYRYIRKQYKITFEKLTEMVNKGKVRFRNLVNPYNNEPFRAYNLSEIENYQYQKKKEKIEERWF